MQNVILNKKILPLSLSSLVSKTGDFAYEVAFSIIVIELLSFDFFYIGIVYFFRFIPYLFFGPLGGWLADALPQKHNMLFSEILRFSTTALLYITYVGEVINIYVLVIFSMIITIGRSLFQPSFRAYLPTVLDNEDLPAGNSLLQIIEDIASIIGPLACSLIIALSDKSYVLLMHSASYLLSIFFLVFLQKNTPMARSKPSLAVVFYDAKNTAMNMRKQNRHLFMVIAGTSVCVLFTASLLRFVLPASIINIYSDETLVGYIFSIMSAGTVLGGVCYTLLVRDSTPMQLMKSWMTYGLLFFAISIAIKFNLISVFIIIFFLGFCGAIVDISIITNIQSLSANCDIGKNYGVYSTIVNTCEAASGLISGIFSLLVGGISFSIISLFIAMAAQTVISRIKRVKHEKEK